MHDDSSLRRLHDRIDSLARDVHTLQLTTIKREGPLVDRLESYHRKVDRMADNQLTRDEFRKAMDDDRYRTFNKRDRVWAGALGMFAVFLQLTSVVVLLYHL